MSGNEQGGILAKQWVQDIIRTLNFTGGEEKKEDSIYDLAMCCKQVIDILHAKVESDPLINQLVSNKRDLQLIHERFYIWAALSHAFEPSSSPTSLETRLGRNESSARRAGVFRRLHDLGYFVFNVLVAIYTGRRPAKFFTKYARRSITFLMLFSEATFQRGPHHVQAQRALGKSLRRNLDTHADTRYINNWYPLVGEKHKYLLSQLSVDNALRRRVLEYLRGQNNRLPEHDGGRNEATTRDVLEDAVPPMESSAPLIDEWPDDSPSFPPLPAGAEDKSSFVCPYCLAVVTLEPEDKDGQWRRHLVEDLEPYTCTFKDCAEGPFTSQHDWFNHELLNHRTEWHCRKCPDVLGSRDGLERHIRQRHDRWATFNKLHRMHDSSRRPVTSISPSDCPFCPLNWAPQDILNAEGKVNADRFRRHLGKHLLNVALFALRTGNEDRAGRPGQVSGIIDIEPEAHEDGGVGSSRDAGVTDGDSKAQVAGTTDTQPEAHQDGGVGSSRDAGIADQDSVTNDPDPNSDSDSDTSSDTDTDPGADTTDRDSAAPDYRATLRQNLEQLMRQLW